MMSEKKIEMATNTYNVLRYSDEQVIGESKLTDDQLQRYMSMVRQSGGTIRLSAMPHEFYDLAPEFQDTREDTMIYLELEV